ncbi:Inositol 2-dehydrogenase OS=Tsukamurella paurometabola (strain ATCC 8368 / DSM / CCUG 35730/ CIP 100753 / JCM 10117 / KCTC 9821 / NBRC 16120 / NCIMB 702349/ NCTC 13040) OX=521096 GN=Tpau_1361 PE=3 SV=1 [Tsukamurella paurometabola]|uniref:Inositol 2-dehydrogenase n=1 Tax=Tsukamurella paurometabola (strain ATCC 8368 / DSM 20162 / CCUG 35730 / CIP 100753 / JCM 10117 / KCTC 9821 / NBRC 16120 / NCIMB 702349 / NCTC 13040) TaxID=521096 RepID=D5UWW8_TSUPD|nr:inositol 2-dehydrogenase [Tsukamurella paurometabola]ADG77990.1 Inositol 2-dehydrogenase [Tsukamurella paurometabola DSM 20162]SUP29670.1 Inositol 2-dehydrogenase [Tsukamurella paurometabola]
MNTTGIAVIGCGRIGRVHADSVAANDRSRLVRVFDPVAAAAKDVGERYAAEWTTEVEHVLAADDVDAVIVASPTSTHIDLLTRAVRAGKTVLCEKPIDLDIERVDACRADLGDLTDRVMLGFNRRFDPSFAEVRRRVAAGEIGRLEQLTIISRDPAPPPADYVRGSGGLFRDMMIHDFDLARFFLGKVVSVSALGANLVSDEIRAAGDIDGAVVALRGIGGELATITNSRRCAYGYDQRLEAFGARGALNVTNQRATSVQFSGPDRTDTRGRIHDFFLDRYTPAYRAELDAFIDMTRSGEPAEPGFGDGRAALALADAAARSLRAGEIVHLRR